MKPGCASRILAGFVGAASFGLVVSPQASADGASFFKTQSGKVRCFVTAYDAKVGAPAAVCETYAAASFPNGALIKDLWGDSDQANIVWVDPSGQLGWDVGDIPGSASIQDTVMRYGQTYRAYGWTLEASSSGTRITNDGTGHGMFVSIENVSAF